ncbi:hypothetical protein ACIP66_25025 [Pseudomonas sp. NPDC088429]|uniref:hypothetical protein n=1 Tax=Pseudomonas sp. NPDC088429 TaxID=3364455 RepID=UPI0037F31208
MNKELDKNQEKASPFPLGTVDSRRFAELVRVDDTYKAAGQTYRITEKKYIEVSLDSYHVAISYSLYVTDNSSDKKNEQHIFEFSQFFTREQLSTFANDGDLLFSGGILFRLGKSQFERLANGSFIHTSSVTRE